MNGKTIIGFDGTPIRGPSERIAEIFIENDDPRIVEARTAFCSAQSDMFIVEYDGKSYNVLPTAWSDLERGSAITGFVQGSI